jgi:PleD family two-component response regulator
LKPGLVVTVSAGVAHHREADSFDAVLAIADQRLYRAKAQGRNRVVCGESPEIDAHKG